MDYLTILLADADPLSGGAGWVGAGLLGCVLGWLMFVHLPSKDKQVEKLAAVNAQERKESDDAHERRIIAKDTLYAEMQKQSRCDFKDALDRVVSHCEKETSHMTAMMGNEFKELRNSMDALTSRLDGRTLVKTKEM